MLQQQQGVLESPRAHKCSDLFLQPQPFRVSNPAKIESLNHLPQL
jgi:hypothetical protein